jgi:adenine C2-methylase RlmN of 23S rRNA A2503 and tRNA A37
MDSFIRDLEIMNVPVSVRSSAGRDIDGACGQLAGKKSYGKKQDSDTNQRSSA